MTRRPNLLLSFDVEEFDLPEEYGISVPENERNAISRNGMQTLLDLLEETNTRATMFVTGYFAERNPDILKRMLLNHHEIASHGLNHTTFEKSHLLESKRLLEKLTGQTVTGFRMARLSPVPKESILEAGYQYESSLNPIWLPGRYNNINSPLLPFQEACGLWQYPISAVPYLRFPLFWLSFKTLPLPLYKQLAFFAISRTRYFNMYSHPWEYCSQTRNAQWHIPRYITRHAGQENANRLKSLILSLKTKGNFITFQEDLTDRHHL